MRASNPDRWVAPRALAGVIATGLLLGGVASVMPRSAAVVLTPATAEAATVVATSGSKDAKPAAKAPAAAKTTASAKPAARKAAAPHANAPAPTAGVVPAKGVAVQSSVRLDEPLTYQYNALGRRDPFQSLLEGQYVGSDVGGDAPPDIGALKVVGIVWGDADQFALVEDARGDSHILRRGDKVMNGFVEGLKRNGMVVNLTVDGQSQSVTIPLTRKVENANANR